MLVRLGQEVQEVPRRVTRRHGVPLALVGLVGVAMVSFAGVAASGAEVASTACPPPATDLSTVVHSAAPPHQW
jgi:hypothetical protein